MFIAKLGNFVLEHKVFITPHVNTTFDINICKIQPDRTSYVIADFNSTGELVSCGNRLLESIESQDDLDNVKVLARIGSMIHETDMNVPADYADWKDNDK